MKAYLIITLAPLLASLFQCDDGRYIYALILMSSLPYLLLAQYLGKIRAIFRPNKPKKIHMGLIYIGIVSGFLNIGLIVKDSEISILSDGIGSVQAIASHWAILRYTEGLDPTRAYLIGLLFVSLILACSFRLWKQLSISMLLLISTSVLTLARWPAFIGISLIFGFIFTNSKGLGFNVVYFNSGRDMKKLIILAGLILLGLFLLIYSVFLRTGGTDFDLVEILKNIGNYILPQYCNLGIWAEDLKVIDTLQATYFAGPSNLLGIERAQGLGYRQITNQISSSNIYTVYRPMIETLTILGPFFISLLSSITILWLSNRRDMDGLRYSLTSIMLASSLIHINVSIFKDNSLWVALLLSLIILTLSPPMRRIN